jgi:integrase/recombinase XerD
MSTVKIIRKHEKANKKDEAPLYLRIIKDRKPKYIALSIHVTEKQWDEESQRVRKSYPNSLRVNNYIAKKVSEALGIAIDMETEQKYVQPKKIKDAILGISSESFIKYAERYLSDLESKNKLGTHDKANAVLAKIKKYINNKDLIFNDITVNWLKNYESYLQKELGNSTNTIHSNLKVIRRLINEAVSEDILPFEKNPFIKFKLKWDQPKKEFLTEEELEKFETISLTPNSMKVHHRNIFIFAAYTGGLRISDILQLKWSNFNGSNILVSTQKTNSVVSIKLPNKSLEILHKYKTEECKPDEYIFPFLKKDIDLKDPKILFNTISSQTSYANGDLKDIAKELEIKKNIHFHVSRHTWATRALKKGMRIEYVSKLMGHSSIKTTQIYAKIVNEELDNAMEVFN